MHCLLEQINVNTSSCHSAMRGSTEAILVARTTTIIVVTPTLVCTVAEPRSPLIVARANTPIFILKTLTAGETSSTTSISAAKITAEGIPGSLTNSASIPRFHRREQLTRSVAG
jgi:hypothetical protein